MIDNAFEAGQVVLMHPIENGFFGASDVGCPSGGIGLLRGDHVEGVRRRSRLRGCWARTARRRKSARVWPQALKSGRTIVSSVFDAGTEETRSDGSTILGLSMAKNSGYQTGSTLDGSPNS